MTHEIPLAVNDDSSPAAGTLAQFLAGYTPEALGSSEWAAWRDPVLELVERREPANASMAYVAAGLLCEAIAWLAPQPGTDLGEVLTDAAIASVVQARRRRGAAGNYAAAARRELNLLQAVARGFARPRRVVSGSGPAWAPGGGQLELLAAIADGGDEQVAGTARALADSLAQVRPGAWELPVDAAEYARFRRRLNAKGMGLQASWPALKSERVRAAMGEDRAQVELFHTLAYGPKHWDQLAWALPSPDGQTRPTTRGHANLSGTSRWSIRSERMTVSSDTAQGRRSGTARGRKAPSRAEARRRAQAAADADLAPPPLPAELEEILVTWVPGKMSAQDWKLARALTCDAMRRGHIRGQVSFLKHLRIVAEHVAWALRSGIEADLREVLSEQAIDLHMRALRDALPASSLATRRSDLRLLASRVNAAHGGPVRPVTLAHTDVKPPYTEQEAYWLVRRIDLIKHAPLRRTVMTAAALGLGAGLTAEDMRGMSRDDVVDHGAGGIEIHVPGRRPRRVWLRWEYEAMLREGIECLTRAEHILGRRQHKNTVNDIYASIQPAGDGPRVLQGRMRSTWIAKLMCEPVPLKVILQAAGLEGARTLAEIASYIEPVQELSAVRGAA